MATIVTNITGATAVNRPLTNTELDNNFINLNTAITSFAETDTLATVTGRGATTSTDITLGNSVATSITNFGGTTANYLQTSANGSLYVRTKDQTTVSSKVLYLQTGNNTLSGSNTGNISIKTGNATGGGGAFAGDISISPGSGDTDGAIITITGGQSTAGTTSTGGSVTIKGGASGTTSSTTAIGGTLYIYGGEVTSANNFSKTTGSVYIDGGGAQGLGTITYGSVNIGTSSSGSTSATSTVNIGNSANTTVINGTVKLPNVGTSGFVKLGTGGQLSADTTSYLTTNSALGTPASGTLSSCTVDGTNPVGYLNIPQNSQSAAYTTVLSDAGKHIYHPAADTNARTYTIAANASVAYPIGTVIAFVNMTSQTVTIAINSDTLYLGNTGLTGSRSLAQYGVANALKITSTSWIITGTGLT
jgi:hypothetical protein